MAGNLEKAAEVTAVPSSSDDGEPQVDFGNGNDSLAPSAGAATRDMLEVRRLQQPSLTMSN
jgi:hypothetical protein